MCELRRLMEKARWIVLRQSIQSVAYNFMTHACKVLQLPCSGNPDGLVCCLKLLVGTFQFFSSLLYHSPKHRSIDCGLHCFCQYYFLALFYEPVVQIENANSEEKDCGKLE